MAESPTAPGLWRDDGGADVAHHVLMARVAGAACVLLGEQHDRADHHRWQLHVAAGLGAAGPRARVVGRG